MCFGRLSVFWSKFVCFDLGLCALDKCILVKFSVFWSSLIWFDLALCV